MRFIFSFFLVFTVLSMSTVLAQQSRFLFLQTENRQPFNVTLNAKMYSSTATGYLIVPKLTEGNYTITVGFGGNSIPEQVFAIAIEKKDVGYNLKNFGDKGWGLFNLQSFEVTMAGEPLKKVSENIASATSASKDAKPDVKRFEPEGIPVKSKEEPAAAATTVQPLQQVENHRVKPSTAADVPSSPLVSDKQDLSNPSATAINPTAKVLNVANEVEPASESRPSFTNEKANEPSTNVSLSSEPVLATKKSGAVSAITKISQINGAEAYYITYIDAISSGIDTIQVLVPNVQIITKVVNENNKDKGDLRFLDIETRQQPTETIQKTDTMPPAQSTYTPTGATVQQCISVAGNQDFLALRKTMAAGNTDDDMMDEAKKAFRVMCFTTTQVKNLSYLFLTDKGRYQFFDLAYPHVADQQQFASLASELTDPYYLNRFNAMLITKPGLQ